MQYLVNYIKALTSWWPWQPLRKHSVIQKVIFASVFS